MSKRPTVYTVPEQQKLNGGFTLLEMMVVIAIIAISVSLAVPNLMLWFDNLSVKSAARDLYSAMQEARMIAVEQNTSVAIVFDTTNSRYYICSDPGADGNWGAAADMTGSGDNVIERSVSLLSSAYKTEFSSAMEMQPHLWAHPLEISSLMHQQIRMSSLLTQRVSAMPDMST